VATQSDLNNYKIGLSRGDVPLRIFLALDHLAPRVD